MTSFPRRENPRSSIKKNIIINPTLCGSLVWINISFPFSFFFSPLLVLLWTTRGSVTDPLFKSVLDPPRNLIDVQVRRRSPGPPSTVHWSPTRALGKLCPSLVTRTPGETTFKCLKVIRRSDECHVRVCVCVSGSSKTLPARTPRLSVTCRPPRKMENHWFLDIVHPFEGLIFVGKVGSVIRPREDFLSGKGL